MPPRLAAALAHDVMLFNSFQFAAFFALVFAAFVAAPARYRTAVLLAASLTFYTLWVPSYVLLLVGTLAANFLLTRQMSRSAHPRRYLIASITLTLSILAIFKYAAFGLGLAMPILARIGRMPRIPEITLPLGISFYSFEIISLAVDVYGGKRPCPSFGKYMLFVTFFPHLIAGPIMRGDELLPQLEQGGRRTRERTRRGLWLFSVGLVKKAILSDYLLLPFVTEIFGVPGATNAPCHLIAAYSFAFQIYFDFSGYSDMARGLACVLGFELPMNFEEPYLSRSPSEFWRRWHITLSRWLRDYLYIPLGGNRRGGARTLVNLFVTMLLGGLWHGAGLNFVVWGGIHGVLLALGRLVRKHGIDENRPITWSDLPAILSMFNLVSLAWIPFRAGSWADSTAFVRGLTHSSLLHGWPILPTITVVVCCALHGAERALRTHLPAIHARVADAAWGPALEGSLLGVVLAASVLASGGGVEFIYFQF